MQHHTLPLAALRPHPDNANVMPPAMLRKLVEHLRATGQYPPIIVRQLPPAEDAAEGAYNASYQILDGHHRVAALRELGHDTADCSVWEVDDQQALVLLATLNRLQGEDDPRRRGTIVQQLSERIALPALAKLLPEDANKLGKLVELCQPPRPMNRPTPMAALPVAVHFFLLPAQRQQLDARLKQQGGTREQALLSLLQIEAAHG